MSEYIELLAMHLDQVLTISTMFQMTRMNC